MSQTANWSYTAEATTWPLLGREDWAGGQTYGAPVTFACSYQGETKTRTDRRGDEYTSRQIIYCEQPGIKQGDKIAIGRHTTIPADAEDVRDVIRYHDVFENAADDFEVLT
jgi:hypothetical protein